MTFLMWVNTSCLKHDMNKYLFDYHKHARLCTSFMGYECGTEKSSDHTCLRNLFKKVIWICHFSESYFISSSFRIFHYEYQTDTFFCGIVERCRILMMICCFELHHCDQRVSDWLCKWNGFMVSRVLCVVQQAVKFRLLKNPEICHGKSIWNLSIG